MRKTLSNFKGLNTFYAVYEKRLFNRKQICLINISDYDFNIISDENNDSHLWSNDIELFEKYNKDCLVIFKARVKVYYKLKGKTHDYKLEDIQDVKVFGKNKTNWYLEKIGAI
jgi:hypothetical protein